MHLDFASSTEPEEWDLGKSTSFILHSFYADRLVTSSSTHFHSLTSFYGQLDKVWLIILLFTKFYFPKLFNNVYVSFSTCVTYFQIFASLLVCHLFSVFIPPYFCLFFVSLPLPLFPSIPSTLLLFRWNTADYLNGGGGGEKGGTVLMILPSPTPIGVCLCLQNRNGKQTF